MTKNVNFQYAVLHYRHDISTGEILNIGLVLYAKEASLFVGKVTTKYQRISKTYPGADIIFLRKFLSKIQSKLTFQSHQTSKSSNKFDDFRPKGLKGILSEVIQYDDSSVFFGEIKTGLLPIDKLESYFNQLYYKMIDQYQTKTDRSSRSDDEVWNHFKKAMSNHAIVDHLKSTTLNVNLRQFEFDHSWKNGRYNILQPVSFDLMYAENIKRKSLEWFGTLSFLNNSDELSNIYILLGEPLQKPKEAQKEYEISKEMLRQVYTKYNVEIIEEHNAEYFAKSIKPKIERDLKII